MSFPERAACFTKGWRLSGLVDFFQDDVVEIQRGEVTPVLRRIIHDTVPLVTLRVEEARSEGCITAEVFNEVRPQLERMKVALGAEDWRELGHAAEVLVRALRPRG